MSISLCIYIDYVSKFINSVDITKLSKQQSIHINRH